MKNNGINTFGVVGLVALVGSVFTANFIAGIMFCLIGLILTIVLYAKIDKLGYGTTLSNMNIYQWVIVLIPTIGVAYYGINRYTKQSQGISFLIITCSLALLFFLAIINYFIAKSLLSVAQKVDNQWFKISGVLTKIAAYTMVLAGLGLFFLVLAQPFFLLGCITYKDNILKLIENP